MDRRTGERAGSDDTRQWRLSALRDLAQEETARPTPTASAPAADHPAPTLAGLASAPPHRAAMATLATLATRAGGRRWGALVAVIVAAVVICGAVLGSIAQHSGITHGPFGPFGAKPAPALTSAVFSLRAAQGTLSCPSTPVWSPDGKRFAVFAAVGPSGDGCGPYNDVTNIQRSDTSGGNGGVTTSGPPRNAFTIVIFDASSGHALRTIKLPELTNSVLCAGDTRCDSILAPQWIWATPHSVGWSPDGRAVTAFFTYTYSLLDGIHYQDRGLLVVASVDVSSAPRTLIANGRVHVQALANTISGDTIYTQPRFTWDLATGEATYADIHQGQYPLTVVFAPGYHLDADGALILDQRTEAGDVSPWRAGVLIPNGPQGASPAISYQTSQWLWSADSRFVTPNLDTAAYLTLAGVTGAPPAADSFITTAETTLAPPDTATAQAVKASARASSVAALARNPNGTLLASYGCGPDGRGWLTIRSVATGKTLAQASYTYPLASTSLGCAGDLGPIAWSPDGARIVATDGPDGQFIVWRVNSSL